MPSFGGHKLRRSLHCEQRCGIPLLLNAIRQDTPRSRRGGGGGGGGGDGRNERRGRKRSSPCNWSSSAHLRGWRKGGSSLDERPFIKMKRACGARWMLVSPPPFVTTTRERQEHTVHSNMAKCGQTTSTSWTSSSSRRRIEGRQRKNTLTTQERTE